MYRKFGTESEQIGRTSTTNANQAWKAPSPMWKSRRNVKRTFILHPGLPWPRSPVSPDAGPGVNRRIRQLASGSPHRQRLARSTPFVACSPPPP